MVGDAWLVWLRFRARDADWQLPSHSGSMMVPRHGLQSMRKSARRNSESPALDCGEPALPAAIVRRSLRRRRSTVTDAPPHLPLPPALPFSDRCFSVSFFALLPRCVFFVSGLFGRVFSSHQRRINILATHLEYYFGIFFWNAVVRPPYSFSKGRGPCWRAPHVRS